MKIYHNPKCSKSRAALAHLNAMGAALQIISYLDSAPSVSELLALMDRSESAAEDFVRWPDANAAGLSVVDKQDPEQIAALIAAHPVLLQRPLVDTGTAVVICRSDAALALLQDQ